MKILKSVQEVREYVKAKRRKGRKIGFVPTMGALHEGHLDLGRDAFNYCREVIYSIYVNPTQFGPNEDLDKYPRTLNTDLQKLETIGVEAVFVPSDEIMYSKQYSTFVINDQMSKVLCGQYRAGHFKGVLTVVLKLINIVKCDYAFFGEKDRQQLLLIKKMIEDLNVDCKIIGVPIRREGDGLAMSSRNRYLSENQRNSSNLIYKALNYLKDNKSRDLPDLLSRAEKIITENNDLKIQYLEVRDENLNLVEDITKTEKCFVFAAVFAGDTRLIDNLEL